MARSLGPPAARLMGPAFLPFAGIAIPVGTIVQIAVGLTSDRTYNSDLERESRNPTITVVEKLAVVLDAQVGALLDEALD